MANIYFKNLFYNGLYNSTWSNNDIYDDPNIPINSRVPRRSPIEKWTFIKNDQYIHRPFGPDPEPFTLYLKEIKSVLGTYENVQVRLEAKMTEYFYNDTQHAFAETRIMKKTLTMKFLGPQPMVFKPGMPLEGQLSIMFNDIIPIDIDTLQTATVLLQFKNQNGVFENIVLKLNDIVSDENFDLFKVLSSNHEQKDFREKGLIKYKVDVPQTSEIVKISAKIETENHGILQSSTTAYKMKTTQENHYIHVRSSSKEIAVGHFVVFHAKTNFPFEHFDWLIVSKNLIIQSGREYGSNIHPEVKTFSVVASPNMAPGKIIVLYRFLALNYNDSHFHICNKISDVLFNFNPF